MPRDKFFKVAFVFGQKTFDSIMKSNISEEIKSELQKTNKYAEGRRIRIEIKNDSKIQDIKTLVKIKLAN